MNCGSKMNDIKTGWFDFNYVYARKYIQNGIKKSISTLLHIDWNKNTLRLAQSHIRQKQTKKRKKKNILCTYVQYISILILNFESLIKFESYSVWQKDRKFSDACIWDDNKTEAMTAWRIQKNRRWNKYTEEAATLFYSTATMACFCFALNFISCKQWLCIF